MLLACVALVLLAGCDKPPAETARPPVEVTAVTIVPRDHPVEMEFVAETRSSRQGEIRARLSDVAERKVLRCL